MTTAIAAKANPDIQFIGLDQAVCVDENADPDPTFACAGDAAALLPNYQGLIFAEAQAGYLAGIVAATLSETGVIGDDRRHRERSAGQGATSAATTTARCR